MASILVQLLRLKTSLCARRPYRRFLILVFISVLSTALVIGLLHASHTPALTVAEGEAKVLDGYNVHLSTVLRPGVPPRIDPEGNDFEDTENKFSNSKSAQFVERTSTRPVPIVRSVEACALLISSGPHSVTSHNARVWLESFRMRVVEKIATARGDVNLGELMQRTRLGREGERVGMYAIVIIDDAGLYLKDRRKHRNVHRWQAKLDTYCSEFAVGQILFPGRLTTQINVLKTTGWFFAARSIAGLTHAALAQTSSVDGDKRFFHVGKPGRVHRLQNPNTLTLVFTPFDSTYMPLEVMWRDGKEQLALPVGAPSADEDHNYTTVLLDRGTQDGVQRVIFGRGLFLWMHKLILVDALKFLIPGHVQASVDGDHSGLKDFGLSRHIGIDIDDVFGSLETQHMDAKDVEVSKLTGSCFVCTVT